MNKLPDLLDTVSGVYLFISPWAFSLWFYSMYNESGHPITGFIAFAIAVLAFYTSVIFLPKRLKKDD